MRRPSSPRSPLAVAALALGLLAALLLLVAGPGTRVGLWHFSTGFQLLRWGAYVGVVAIVVSLAAAWLTRPGHGRGGFALALLGLGLGLVAVGVPWSWRQKARSVPPIHDISTDTENPPQFVAIAPLRQDAPNPIEYGGPQIAAQQRTAYPDVRPLVLEMPPRDAFRRALDVTQQMGWELVAADTAALRIEATDRTAWFGFYDDVVIRITPVTQERAVVDVRSLSRVGGSDVGANAERIRKFLQRLRR